MIKTVVKILFVILIFYASFCQVLAGDMKLINLDRANIVPAGCVDMSINNIPVNFTIIKEKATLYIDSDFFLAKFGTYMEKLRTSLRNGAVLKDDPSKLYFPLFKSLSVLHVRYTYSPLYGKEIIRIRTDNDFRIDTTYIYKPASSGSYGNIPYTSPEQLNENGFSKNGYPRVNSVGPGNPG